MIKNNRGNTGGSIKANKSGKGLNPQQKKQIMNMISSTVEHKEKNITTGSLQPTTSGQIVQLTTMSQGVAITQRVGDSVHLEAIKFRYKIQVGATGLIAAADQFNTVRVLIFKWRSDDYNYVPTIADVLDNGVGAAGTLWNHNYYEKFKFKVLYDKVHTVFNTPIWNGSAVAWYHGVDANINTETITIKKGLGQIDFTPGATTGAGNIYALVVSDSAFTPNPTVELVCSTEFHDA